MKLNFTALSIGLLALSSVPLSLRAQTPSSMPSVPTTRILAIDHMPPGTSREKFMPLMQKEVRGTVSLYLSGKLDQWYVRKDESGVVFILNAASVEEARDLLINLPLAQAKFLQFDLIPLGPLSPLGILLQEPVAR